MRVDKGGVSGEDAGGLSLTPGINMLNGVEALNGH
jgi:hypothetical protein